MTLWREFIAPLIALEFASGDGSEERDRQPLSFSTQKEVTKPGKFWMYERIMRIPYYGIYEINNGKLEVYHLVNGFIDQYYASYQDLFPEVRSFESFKFLHLGIISDIKHKSLPAIAKAVGLKNAQSLHHFLANSLWDVKELKQHQWWNKETGWKNVLNNFRLIIQPYLFFCLITPRFKSFPHSLSQA